MFWLYNLLLLLSVPLFPLLKLKARERGNLSLKPRFQTDFKGAQGRLLLHASSVGEVNTVKPLVEKLKDNLALTTFTDYGLKRAQELFPQVPKRLLPIDLYPLTKVFLKKTKPKKLLIYETEIWPSLLRSARELKIPTYFVSGKIGKRTYLRAVKFRKILKPYVEEAFFLARSEEDARRAEEVGFKMVKVVGDLKVDYCPPQKLPPLKVEGKRKVIIWGSTHPGEEEIAVKLHRDLKGKVKNLLTIIAPRHTGRKIEIPNSVRRSQTKRVPKEAEFYIVDTVGELSGLYAYADLCVVGGSFVKGIGGHNLVEAVALKRPTVIGKFADEFLHIARSLKVPILKREELFNFTYNLLKREELSKELANRSYSLWLKERGVAERIVKEVLKGEA
ncbi:3-deoxy-D-manno-octulosonic acid transferase [Thermovibrio sp.]